MIKETTLSSLAEIIVKAMEDEPNFNKEVLIPKIRAIIGAFRIKLSAINYDCHKSPSETAKLIRSKELANYELYFWKVRLQNLVGDEKMNDYYAMLDEKRKLWNGKMSIDEMITINEKHDKLTKQISLNP